MHQVELALMAIQEANNVVGYNEARRQLGLTLYANISELVESLKRVKMDSLFGGDVDAVNFYRESRLTIAS